MSWGQANETKTSRSCCQSSSTGRIKSQAPSSKALPTSQIPKPALPIGVWALLLPWDLELGAWDLSFVTALIDPQRPDRIQACGAARRDQRGNRRRQAKERDPRGESRRVVRTDAEQSR